MLARFWGAARPLPATGEEHRARGRPGLHARQPRQPNPVGPQTPPLARRGGAARAARERGAPHLAGEPGQAALALQGAVQAEQVERHEVGAR
jgi:hypothetical protein